MRTTALSGLVLVVVLLATAPLVTAGVPQLMNYQGNMRNSSGEPLDTIVSITFTIYDDSTGGEVKWTETRASVSITDGGFSVLLGTFSAVDDTTFVDYERWLGITIGSDPEIEPRTRLAAAPYAFRVSTVDGATGGMIADSLEGRPYSSREFISEMGKYLVDNAKKKDSLVQAAYEEGVPIFCPAFSDSSAGFGLVKHQVENPDSHVSIDSVKDFRELTQIKMQSNISGLFMIGGGVPKNFAQDTVVCAEVLGKEVDMHKYAVQITVADVRDGACSSSTLKEASSWGKVETGSEQMVYAEATAVLPLIASYVYHSKKWQGREKRRWVKIFA